jgi:HNH endonuclease
MGIKYNDSDIARFWSKVNKNGDIPAHCPELGCCWEWIGTIVKPTIRPMFWLDGTNRLAYRIIWLWVVGEPKNYICHKCDNGLCIRPSHLFDGTQKENQQDSLIKGRFAEGEKSAQSKLTSNQIIEIRNKHSQGQGIRSLGREYEVSQRAIQFIVRGEHWKSVKMA